MTRRGREPRGARRRVLAAGAAAVLVVGAALALVTWTGFPPAPEPAAHGPTVPTEAIAATTTPAPAPRTDQPPAGEPTADRADNPDRGVTSPDGADVGPCPEVYAHLGVTRSGRDGKGRPTWWHPDGSFTVIATQTGRHEGRPFSIPVVLHATPRRAKSTEPGTSGGG